MFQEVWPDHLVVQEDGSIILNWSHAPNVENALQQPVERDHFGDESREEFQSGEDGKKNPVGEPFGVVTLVRGLDGLDGNVGGVGESNDVAQNLGSPSEGEVQSDQSGDA